MITLYQARRLKGHSQKSMADMLGIHTHTYAKMEKNPDDITVRDAKMISSFLSIDYNSLFFGDNSTLCRICSSAHDENA